MGMYTFKCESAQRRNKDGNVAVAVVAFHVTNLFWHRFLVSVFGRLNFGVFLVFYFYFFVFARFCLSFRVLFWIGQYSSLEINKFMAMKFERGNEMLSNECCSTHTYSRKLKLNFARQRQLDYKKKGAKREKICTKSTPFQSVHHTLPVLCQHPFDSLIRICFSLSLFIAAHVQLVQNSQSMHKCNRFLLLLFLLFLLQLVLIIMSTLIQRHAHAK